jgi:hypothetical protein
MLWLGIAVTVLGFIISLLSLTITTSVGGRMVIVLVGLAVTLVGIIGLINRAFMKDAIWRK